MNLRRSFLAFLLLFNLSRLVAQTEAQVWDRWNSAIAAKDWPKAEAAAALGMQKFPENKNFPPCRVWALRELKRSAEALDLITPLAQQFPQEKAYQESLAYAALDLGWQAFEKPDLPRAQEFFRRAYTALPGSPYTQNAWAVILRDTGSLEDALKLFEQAYAQWPQDPYIPGNYQQALVTQAVKFSEAQDPRATSAFQKAQALAPLSETFLINYGWHLIRQKDYQAALLTFRQAKAQHPQSPHTAPGLQHSLQELSRQWFKDQRTAEVEALLREGEKTFPQEIWFALDRYQRLLDTQDWAGAQTHLLRLIKTADWKDYGKPWQASPEDRWQFRLAPLVWKLAEMGRWDPGFQLLKAFETQFPGAWWVQELRGIFTYHSGNHPQGIALVNQAYDLLSPRYPEAQKPRILPAPLKGTYQVWGNNRTDAVTHAGLNRWAYDFLGADSQGRLQTPGAPDPGPNSSYLGFGAPVFSVTGGTVIQRETRFPDKVPSRQSTLGDGNFISIQGPDGLIAHYVHLQQGSIPLKVGDPVTPGQIIGRLGNSGYTSLPHLHFALYTADWRLTIPVVFQTYQVLTPAGPVPQKAQSPQTGEIVEFP